MQNKSILDPLVMAGYNIASQHPQFAANQQLQQQQDPSQMGANLINFSNPYFLAGLAQDSNISNAATYASKLANEEASRNYQNQQSAASQQEIAHKQLSQQRDAALQQILPSIISDLDPLDIVGNTSIFSKFMAPDKAVVFANALSQNAHDLSKEDIKDEREAAKQDREANTLTRKQQLDVQEGLRKEHTAASKNFKEINDSFERIKGLAKVSKNSPAAGIGVIFSYMRMLDPTSTVREGEYATAENAAGIPERVRQQYNKALSGAPLTDVQISDFVRGANSVHKSQKELQNKLDSEFKKRAEKAGVDPEEVFTTYDNPEAPKKKKIDSVFDFSDKSLEDLKREEQQLLSEQ